MKQQGRPLLMIGSRIVARYKRGARTQAIKDYLAEKPAAGPNEVVNALAEKGIKVSVGLVSNIKYGSRAKGAKGKKKARAGGPITVDQLVEIKRLADSFGGVENAQKALETLRKLR
jgi:hypothetical protein